MTLTSKEILDRFRDLRKSDDPESAFALLSPDVQIDEPPMLPYGGKYTGPDGYRQLVQNVYSRYEVVVEADTYDVGDFSCAVFEGTFTARESGRSTPVRIVENYWTRDGLITKIDIFYKNPDAVVGILSDPS